MNGKVVGVLVDVDNSSVDGDGVGVVVIGMKIEKLKGRGLLVYHGLKHMLLLLYLISFARAVAWLILMG